MKLNLPRRIQVEDFPQKDQSLVEKLAYPINLLMDQFIQSLNKNLSIEDNLPFDVKTVSITANTNTPTSTAAFKTTLSNVRGIAVVNAINVQNDTLLSAAVGVEYTFSKTQGIVTIDKIYGLPNDIKFSITFFLLN
jgi:hypothetical protein